MIGLVGNLLALASETEVSTEYIYKVFRYFKLELGI